MMESNYEEMRLESLGSMQGFIATTARSISLNLMTESQQNTVAQLLSGIRVSHGGHAQVLVIDKILA